MIGNAESRRFFVITGGPGSGKSTLIEALAATGCTVMPEAGRAVIREQLATGGTALPWQDRGAFAEAMLERDLASYADAAGSEGTAFFDRGIPDIAGYLRLEQLPVPERLTDAIARHRYAPTVFIAPPWETIYGQDAERKQEFATAVRTHAMMREVYAARGYALVPLPLAPVAERVRFVLDRVSA